MFMLMLFRTMTDGVGLDDYYNNIVVDCSNVVGDNIDVDVDVV